MAKKKRSIPTTPANNKVAQKGTPEKTYQPVASNRRAFFNFEILERYEAGIHWCLARPGKICAMAGVAFLGSLLLLPIIGSQFFPSGTRDQFFIKV
jgi:multidrug efflux pump subunit AcrB